MPATAKQVKTIEEAFASLPRIEYLNRLLNTCHESEKQHRRGQRPAPKRFSAITAARYFTVKWLKDAALREGHVRPKEYLHIRPECFLALAIADEFTDALVAWAQGPLEDFDALDYAKLME